MASSLLSFLSPAKIEESIPEGVLPGSVKSGSVIQMRSRNRFIPTSGASYAVPGGSKIVQLRITGNDYLDLPTACLHFKIDVTPAPSASASYYLIQEGIYSIIQRVRVALNSVIVSDCDNVHIATHSKVLNTMPRQVYDSVDGHFMGLYKKATTSQTSLLAGTYPTSAQAGAIISAFYDDDVTDGSFFVPLSLICPFFAQKTFLPLRNCGNLEVTLFLEDPTVCFWSNAAAPTGLAYALSDVSLEVDSVQLAAPVVQMIDRLTADTSETGGVVLPCITEVMQSINYQGSGAKSVSISRGTTALTALTLMKRNQDDVGKIDRQALSTFKYFGQNYVQIRLGSRLYPTTRSDTPARMVSETRLAYGMLNNMVSGGLVDRPNYTGNGSGTATDVSNNQSAYTYAYNFRRVRSEDLSLDGENSIQSGSIIQVDFDDNPAAGGQSAQGVLHALIESLRYVELKGSSVNCTGM